MAGADPGFSVGRGAKPQRGEWVPTYDFVKILVKLNEIQGRPPLICYCINLVIVT